MAGDGERNYLAIVALVIALIFVIAATAGFVVWRRQHVADMETRATSSPVSPPTPTTPESVDPLPSHLTDPGIARRTIGPRGSAAVGALDPTPVANAEQAIARLRPGFRSCYNKGLASDPSMEGSITIAITVAKNGDVDDVVKKSGHGLSSDVEACIIKRARNATFDAPTSGGTATISVPVTFARAH